MRDLLESSHPHSPVEAARRAARPMLQRRFYATASVADTGEGGYAVRLDGKPVRTPAGRVLAAPTRALAEVVAAEWEAQSENIDPAKMPLTRLANAIIDGVGEHAGAVAGEVAKYLACDLICYRAGAPSGLAERQTRAWDPILAWAREALGARFSLAEGVVHVAQPEAALAAARAALPIDAWRLGAVHVVTTLTGSALIALALAHGRLTAEEAWQAAHVDEDWNMEQWGRDELALSRRATHFAELEAAALVLCSV